VRIRLRTSWRNHTGNQGCDPLGIHRPSSLGDLVELVRGAESLGVSVRAVGAGHSWSDEAPTTGLLLDPQGLASPLELERDVLREGVDPLRLARCEAGIRLRDLNRDLESEGRALLEMGGYDGQSIGGAILARHDDRADPDDRHRGRARAAARLRGRAYELRGRPHWGQVNTLTGSRDRVRSLYPPTTTGRRTMAA
jgi:hypothetical protein